LVKVEACDLAQTGVQAARRSTIEENADMEQAIGGATPLSTAAAQAPALRTVATLRLATGSLVLLGALLFFFGTAWDIQWHTYVGRDRTLIAPHLLMLSGVALSGIVALVALLYETVRAQRGTPAPTTRFAGVFHGAMGAYIAGFAALTAAVAFPLDSYWHSLYGIDVAILAPFHVMFVVSMGLVALGAVHLLASGTHLASRTGRTGASRWGTRGQIIAYATVLALLTILLFDLMDTGDRRVLSLGPLAINVFPFLAAALSGWVLVAAVVSLPGRWVATRVAGVYVLFSLVVLVVVPPLTDWLLQVEHLAYRPGRALQIHLPLVGIDWPLAPLLAAFLLDWLVGRVRQAGQEPTVSQMWKRVAVSGLPVPLLLPLGLIALISTTASDTDPVLGMMGAALSLLLALVGAWLGSGYGQLMGEALSTLEG
jgi:hypothetical protein